jgi:hypothetical protein
VVPKVDGHAQRLNRVAFHDVTLRLVCGILCSTPSQEPVTCQIACRGSDLESSSCVKLYCSCESNLKVGLARAVGALRPPQSISAGRNKLIVETL